MFYCPSCGEEIIKSYGDEHKIKFRTNICIWDIKTGICICKCLQCKAEVEIPLMLKLTDGRIIGNTDEKKKRKKASLP